jgi:gluconolactonase
MNRRTFLKSTAATASVFSFGIPRTSSAAADRYDGLQSDKYVGKVQVLATVEDKKIFTEGPAADRAGNLFFTNVPMSKILNWDPKTRKLSVFRENSNLTNGLYFDPQGRLLCCEGRASRVTRTDMKTGKIEVLADKHDGKPFAKPNDVCLDNKGRIYFTARSAAKDLEGETPKGVYRIDPNGTVTALLQPPAIHMPNGIVTSPDNKTLYLIEAHPGADHHRDIRAYDLKSDGSLANERIHINFYPGRSGDGMCIDADGNLYVAAGLHKTRNTSETLDTRPGIHVVSPAGKLIAFRETPEDTITNCTFGGDDLQTLYVTCGTKLLAIRTKIPGKASYRPNA